MKTWRTPRMVPEAELTDLRWPSLAIRDAAAHLNAAILGGCRAGLLVFVEKLMPGHPGFVDYDPNGYVPQIEVEVEKRVEV